MYVGVPQGTWHGERTERAALMEASRRNYYAAGLLSFVLALMIVGQWLLRDGEATTSTSPLPPKTGRSAQQASVVDIPGRGSEPGSTTQTAFSARSVEPASESGPDDDEATTVVPKYVHLIWFYPPETSFRFHHLMCLMSIKLHVKPQRIILWHNGEQPRGAWWAFAKKAVSEIALMPYAAPTTVFNQSLTVVEHQSDVARLDILLKYGGIYFDLDVIALRDFEPLLRYPVTLGAETPDLLGSGLILARPNATFLRLWRDSYRNYEPRRWNYNSVVVPMRLAKDNADAVHIEWFAIHRPNWFERHWLYTEGKLWDWSENYAVHLWYRTHDRDYDPITIRTLNTTVGEIFRYVYYGRPELMKT